MSLLTLLQWQHKIIAMKDMSTGMMFLASERSAWETGDFKHLVDQLQPHINNLSPGSFCNPVENANVKMFKGREEVDFCLRKKGAFTYVIRGAFEVQHRLIETGDGVALWNTSNIEIEALSDNAVILVIELE